MEQPLCRAVPEGMAGKQESQACIRDVKLEPEDDVESFIVTHDASDGATLYKDKMAAQLATGLSANAQAAWQRVPCRDKVGCNLKGTTPNHQYTNEERSRKMFRSLAFTAGANTQGIVEQLQDLCNKWLKPELRSTTEIVELIVLEQFTQILPTSAQEWLRHHSTQSIDITVRLIKDYFTREGPKSSSEEWNGTVTLQHDALASCEAHTKEILRERRLSVGSRTVNPTLPGHRREPPTKDHLNSMARQRTDKAGSVVIKAEDTPPVMRRCKRLHYTQTAEESLAEASMEMNDLDHRAFKAIEDTQAIIPGRRSLRNQIGARLENSTKETGPRAVFPVRCGVKRAYSSKQGNARFDGKDKEDGDPASNGMADSKANGMNVKTSNRDANTDTCDDTNQCTYKCGECGKNFKSNANLKVHKRIHSGAKPYHCTECGKSFSQKTEFVLHQRKHSSERPVKCPECENSFIRNSDLILHRRIHIGDGTNQHTCHDRNQCTYICGECGKNFKSNAYLKIHKRIHSGAKPYKCTECEKSFNQKTELVLHHRKHSGERPFKCLECEKCFIRNSDLIVHRRIHTGERPYNCLYCGQGFIRSSLLAVHRKRYHSNKK